MQTVSSDFIDGFELIQFASRSLQGGWCAMGPASCLVWKISTSTLEFPVQENVEGVPLVVGGSVVLHPPDPKETPRPWPCRSSYDVDFLLRLNRVHYDRRGVQARLIYDVEQTM